MSYGTLTAGNFMPNTILESQVKKQSGLLAKEMPKILASALMVGKFIAFFDGATIVGNTHEECFNKAEKQFGNKGFAIAEVTPNKLMVSALVKF